VHLAYVQDPPPLRLLECSPEQVGPGGRDVEEDAGDRSARDAVSLGAILGVE
jgi:hypothetical protein